jgi:hypothetical protein
LAVSSGRSDRVSEAITTGIWGAWSPKGSQRSQQNQDGRKLFGKKCLIDRAAASALSEIGIG